MRIGAPATIRDLPTPEEVVATGLGGRPSDEPAFVRLAGSWPARAATPPPRHPTLDRRMLDGRALDALAAAADRLGSEQLDALALEALDAEERAAMAPRLAAVRAMAHAVAQLLAWRGEAARAARGRCAS